MSIDIEQVVRYLEASLDPRQNKQAELALKQEEKRPGFAIVLLQIVANDGFSGTARLASALCFKNFVRRTWIDEDGNHKLPKDEVASIKQEIIGLMISVPANIQSQLGDAVSVISDSDFWRNWDSLIDDLVSRLTAEDTKVNNGVLQVAHSIFKRWRPLFRSDELYTEILHVLDRFVQPYLQLLLQTDQLIDQSLTNPSRLRELLGTLNLLIKIMYDLSCQDLPPAFEDNLESLTVLLQKYLVFKLPSIDDDEEDAGPLEFIKSGIFEVLSLWTTKYGDDFGKYVEAFVGSTWTLLTAIGSETRYDVLVSKGLHFLTSITQIAQHAKSFDDDGTLSQVLEKVVLPNISLRDSDLDLFEDEPIEFIRRDLEGSDSDTRRRAATDFLRGLLVHSQARVTTLVNKYVDHFLMNYAENTSGNWRSKDTAVYLFSSIAAIGAVTARDGVKTVNPLVDILHFLERNIAGDLLSQGEKHPILKVDAIKYIYTFRSQINRDQWRAVLPPLVQQLASDNYVIYTYGAIALERALALRSADGHPTVDKEMIMPSVQPLIEHLFKLIETEHGADPTIAATKFQENEFLMKCVMRVLMVLKEQIDMLVDILLIHLLRITEVISINPSNPRFCYYHFESLGALVKYGGYANQSKLEESLYRPLIAILENDIQDFVPYIFQLFAALLENDSQQQSLELYQALVGPILRIDFWLIRGYVPALVRLLTSLIIRSPQSFQSQIEPVLGIFKRLFDSKANEGHAFDLLECVLATFTTASMEPYYVPLMQMALTKLQDTKSETYTARFVRLYHFFCARGGQGLGTDLLINILDRIQAGLIVQVYMGVVIPNTTKLSRPMDRKIAVISLTKTLTDSKAFAEKYKKGWTTTCNALLELLINPPVISYGEEALVEHDVEDSSFGIGFTQLMTIRRPPHDYWPSITNVKIWVGESLRRADGEQDGRIAAFVYERLPDQSKTALLNVMQSVS